MSPHAYTFTLAATKLARQPAPHQIPRLHTLLRCLAETLLDTRAPQPAGQLHTPTEDAPVQVLWAKAGTPGEVGDVWCDGTYIRTAGHGADQRFLVRSTTPHHATPAPCCAP
jgi:hypothetical protein